MKKLSILLNNWNNTSKKKYLFSVVLLFIVFSLILYTDQRATALNDTLHTTELKTSREWLEPLTAKKKKGKELADSIVLVGKTYIKEADFYNALRATEYGLSVYKSLDKGKEIGNALNQIASIYYYQGKYLEALSYYDQSIVFYESVNFKKGIASSVNNKGAIYYLLGNYPKALNYYKQAVELNEVLNDEKQIASTIQNIGAIYLELSDYESAMKYFLIAKKTFESIADTKTLSQVLNGMGEIYLRQENHTNALAHFKKALKLAMSVDDKQRILESVYNLGNVYAFQSEQKSLNYYVRSLNLAKEIENALYESYSLIGMGTINLKLNKKQLAIANCKEGLEIAKALKIISAQEEGCKCLYSVYKSLNEMGAALAYFEQSVSLKDSLQARQTADNILNMEFEKQVLMDSIAHVEKEKKIKARYIQEVARKEKQRNILIVSGCFALTIAGGLWSRLNYTTKAKATLQVEKDLSEHLLLNILPGEIAKELKAKGHVDAQNFEAASILFTDFQSFTKTASKLSPQELVEEINVCFKAFDGIIEIYNIEKIKTIGDAYMAAGGLPRPDAKAVKNTILAAIDMQTFITNRKLENTGKNKPAFDMRVGIHVGPIVAGIVGVKKFQYDVWGDTVNTASRMESYGAINKVNISQDTYLLVKEEKDLLFEHRGKIIAKGKGALEMYFVKKAS